MSENTMLKLFLYVSQNSYNETYIAWGTSQIPKAFSQLFGCENVHTIISYFLRISQGLKKTKKPNNLTVSCLIAKPTLQAFFGGQCMREWWRKRGIRIECNMCLEAKEKFKAKVGTIINNEITTIDDSNYFCIEC